MSDERSLYDVFNSLHNMAVAREESRKQQNTKTVPCLCGKNLANTHSEGEECESDLNDLIYVEGGAHGSRFAVCPACDPKPSCSLCAGSGHRTYLNNLTLYACSCMHVHKLVAALNEAGIPDKYVHADFSSFSTQHLNETQSKKLRENILKMERFCGQCAAFASGQKDGTQKYFVTLFGPVGGGKTLLATAGLKTLIATYGLHGYFVDFQYLLSQLRAAYDEKKTGESILKKLRETDVLLIDEFGKGRSDKEWQLEKLDDLVNVRYNAKKVTIITTNYLPSDLRYDKKDMPFAQSRDMYASEFDNVLPNETFWHHTLPERIGLRMYERLLEVSEFIDFVGIPSYRRLAGARFLEMYSKNYGN